VHYLSGQAHRLAGRFRDAIHDLRAAWELDPANVHTCLALGWCHKRLGELDQAVSALQHGLTVDNRCGILHFNLACYMSLGGQIALALTHLARAIELDRGFRDLAIVEADFAGIRHVPAFRELAHIQ
jgi:Flp pilus assembly protein TadD